MNLQKELAPPGIHDGACAIAKSTRQTITKHRAL